MRGKPRFLHLLSIEKAGQAAHFVTEHVPELPGNMFTPWGQAAGYSHPALALPVKDRRKRDKIFYGQY
jgi:hypothetical protein